MPLAYNTAKKILKNLRVFQIEKAINRLCSGRIIQLTNAAKLCVFELDKATNRLYSWHIIPQKILNNLLAFQIEKATIQLNL